MGKSNMEKELIKIAAAKKTGLSILALVFSAGLYTMGVKNGIEQGYEQGYEEGYEKGISADQEEILASITDLKEELTSDLISLMKAKTQMLNSSESDEKTYNLENIYVLDTNGEGIQTYGTASQYAYRYIIFESDQIPCKGDSYSNFYDIMFVADYTESTWLARISTNPYILESSGRQGSYVVPANDDGILNYVEPLAYYLTDEEFEEIKNGCTYSELENVFYEMNTDQMVQGRVLEKND